MSSSYAVTSSAVTLPGLTWSLPVLAKAWSFNCNLAYSTTSTSSKLELWVDAQQTPQYLVATAEIYVNTAAAAGAYTTASVTPTASGSQSVLTGGTPGATSTIYIARMYGTINPNATTAGSFSIQASYQSGGTSGVSVLEGSYCQLF